MDLTDEELREALGDILPILERKRITLDEVRREIEDIRDGSATVGDLISLCTIRCDRDDEVYPWKKYIVVISAIADGKEGILYKLRENPYV